MPNFLDGNQITQLVNEALEQEKQVLYRCGIDYRFTGKDGFSIKGSLRNTPITLEKLLKEADYYFIELESRECNDQQIVFHGYSVLDME